MNQSEPFIGGEIDERNVYNQTALLAINCLGRAIVEKPQIVDASNPYSYDIVQPRKQTQGARFED